MKSRIKVAVVALFASLLIPTLAGIASAGPPPAPAEALRSRRDDADLASVFFLDAAQGWTVGDHGAVLHTLDAGAHWAAQESGLGCRLRDVYFLNAQQGWIVGGYYDPYVHRSRGVLLRTVDGGATWQLEPTPLLPALRKIRMRTAQEGWAAGDPSTLAPSGLHFTRDGGKTWSAAGGHLPAGIVAADLAAAEGHKIDHAAGTVADGAGRVVALAERFLSATPAAEFGLRTVRDIALDRGGAGTLVGDGGLVLSTEDGGAAWHASGEDLTSGVGAQCDWHAMARHGASLWIVGAPGSVVLHSADAGRHWELLPTKQPLPLRDVAFVDAERGFAVGALGTILATVDGGKTWNKQSYGDRRAALWSCFTDAESMPLELIAKSCTEDGYRTVASLVGRRDCEPGVDSSAAAGDRVADGLSALGISSTQQAWAFPLRQAALQLSASDVLSTWGAGDEAEGLRRIQAHFVLQLRTWRPDVVLTHAPAPRGDLPTNHLLHQLVMQALEAAADPNAFPEQIELLGLAPWQAQKAFGHEPNQTQGTASVKASDVMTRTAIALDEFCSPGRALLSDRRTAPSATVAVRLCMNRTPSAAPERELFAGLVLPAGGDARRTIVGTVGDTILKMRRTAERRRSLEGIVMQKSGTVGVELAGRLRDVTAGLEDEPAGRAVFELAETFRFAGRWEAARETYEYLLTRYPQHSDSEAGLHRLVHYLASSEADQRLRRAMIHTADALAMAPLGASTGEGAISASKPRTVSQNTLGQVESAAGIPGTADRLEKLNITIAQGPPSITQMAVMPTPAAMLLGRNAREQAPAAKPAEAVSTAARETASGAAVNGVIDSSAGSALVGYTGDEDRRRRAIALGAYFESRDPVGHAEPTILFPLAAARRKLGQTAEAESFYKHFVRSHPEDAWWACAASEAAIRNPGTTGIKRQHRSLAATEKPLLDGTLDDAVWRAATPLELRSPLGDDDAWPAVALIAHDAEYLYLAVRCRRTPNTEMPAPTGPRQRDTDLAAQDRVDFCLDLDRDYATYYKLSVDRRGWTAESCWDDTGWDPQWFVAAGGDETTWTVEAAIPWSELTVEPPRSGDAWALGVQRIAPSTGVQSWTAPAAAAIRPEGFGHLTFE
ncbi:MAG: tetratricopeptide repeat protein [Planctomycetia bacterium]|nr:tetratricopeptide repeat protein [Planctomycetia bacterium]